MEKKTSKNTKRKKSKINKRKKKILTKKRKKQLSKKQRYIMGFVTFLLGVLLIFSSYAWFSTALNVKVKNFNMIVSKNSGLSISFDGVNYDSFVEISEKTLIDELKKTYPNNLSQWSNLGLTPVSSNGITNKNNYKFDFFASGGVRYKNKKKENGFINTYIMEEKKVTSYNYFIAFDLFLKNVTGSPINDNLYLDNGTSVVMDSESTNQMMGLVNSVRIGFVKIGSVPLTATVNQIQNVQCNNNCQSIIYEPNSRNHTDTSIERAQKYNVNLVNGERFPTYACVKEVGPIEVKNTVSGSPNLDTNSFALQNTVTEGDFSKPLFEVPNGITKMRVYVWVEGQDIDSLETNSEGADISISINLVKDTAGYNAF